MQMVLYVLCFYKQELVIITPWLNKVYLASLNIIFFKAEQIIR